MGAVLLRVGSITARALQNRHAAVAVRKPKRLFRGGGAALARVNKNADNAQEEQKSRSKVAVFLLLYPYTQLTMVSLGRVREGIKMVPAVYLTGCCPVLRGQNSCSAAGGLARADRLSASQQVPLQPLSGTSLASWQLVGLGLGQGQG